jgi:hypothetical protein
VEFSTIVCVLKSTAQPALGTFERGALSNCKQIFLRNVCVFNTRSSFCDSSLGRCKLNCRFRFSRVRTKRMLRTQASISRSHAGLTTRPSDTSNKKRYLPFCFWRNTSLLFKFVWLMSKTPRENPLTTCDTVAPTRSFLHLNVVQCRSCPHVSSPPTPLARRSSSQKSATTPTSTQKSFVLVLQDLLTCHASKVGTLPLHDNNNNNEEQSSSNNNSPNMRVLTYRRLQRGDPEEFSIEFNESDILKRDYVLSRV